MECVEINGARQLSGRIEIQGSKNAVLPVLAGCILHDGISKIHYCPRIQDVFDTIQILRMIGCRVWWEGDTLAVDASHVNARQIPRSITSRMRSSVLFLGALLGRCQKARICYPGGCVLGERPVDLHIEALRKMGAQIGEEGDCILASSRQLRGAQIVLAFPSVGATENIILAAVMAEGTTIIRNAAREPEIGELCLFLREKGADIREYSDGMIEIRGGTSLRDSEHELAADRIVAGTYLMAAAVTDSCIEVGRVPVEHMRRVLDLLRQMGIGIEQFGNTLRVDGRRRKLAVDLLETASYPGFPTDLQSPAMTLLAVSEGESRIRETIFRDRFKTAAQLRAMGAQIEVAGCEARIRGVQRLRGAEVIAEELRGSAALLLAGLNAGGRTRIHQCHYVERGYEDICGKLRGLGADITEYK